MAQRSVVVAHRELLVAESIASALAYHPSILAVGVSTPEDAEEYGHRADAAALDAYLSRFRAAAESLRRLGVHVVYLGEGSVKRGWVCVSMQGSVASLMTALLPGLTREPSSASPLTRREREVLVFIARGLAAKQIARQLAISPRTVEHHKAHIFEKLGVPNQTAAVYRALLLGVNRPRLSSDRGPRRIGIFTD